LDDLGNLNIILGIMGKAEVKTRPTAASVEEFLNSVPDETRRADAFRVLEMFKRLTGEEPVMWGPAIVGFGSQKLRYANGSELDWPLTGFSPRKQNMTLYVMNSSPKQPELLEKLGPHSTGKSCLYIKRLSDIDEKVLEKVVKDSYIYEKKRGGCGL
jgi:hypothetical protein